MLDKYTLAALRSEANFAPCQRESTSNDTIRPSQLDPSALGAWFRLLGLLHSEHARSRWNRIRMMS